MQSVDVKILHPTDILLDWPWESLLLSHSCYEQYWHSFLFLKISCRCKVSIYQLLLTIQDWINIIKWLRILADDCGHWSDLNWSWGVLSTVQCRVLCTQDCTPQFTACSKYLRIINVTLTKMICQKYICELIFLYK